MSKIKNLVKQLLLEIGEDPQRSGLKQTPERVERAYQFLTRGYEGNVSDVINGAVFEEKYDQMVIVKDIDFYSLCEHHLLPFYGKAHVAYIPDGKLIGLSKIPRIVDLFSRRLQIQERLTNQIADSIEEAITPLGVAVVIEGFHLCMAMRGVEKQNAYMTTSAVLGDFRDDRSTRIEFLELLKKKQDR
jgi:GTP cyclohydrolase IA